MTLTELVIEFLQSDTDVFELAGPRVYGRELGGGRVGRDLDDVINAMPQKCIVVAPAGGLGQGPGPGTTARRAVNRVDVKCYGETPYQADALHDAVYRAMTGRRRFEAGGMRLVNPYPVGGPVPGRDGQAAWPYTLSVYTVAADYE